MAFRGKHALQEARAQPKKVPNTEKQFVFHLETESKRAVTIETANSTWVSSYLLDRAEHHGKRNGKIKSVKT